MISEPCLLLYIRTGRPRWFDWKEKALQITNVFSNLSVWKIHHLVHQRNNSSLFIEDYRHISRKSFRIFSLIVGRRTSFTMG